MAAAVNAAICEDFSAFRVDYHADGASEGVQMDAFVGVGRLLAEVNILTVSASWDQRRGDYALYAVTRLALEEWLRQES